MNREGDPAGRDATRRNEAGQKTAGGRGEPAGNEERETPDYGKPIWGRLGVRTIVAALVVLTLLVALGLLLGPEYWRF